MRILIVARADRASETLHNALAGAGWSVTLATSVSGIDYLLPRDGYDTLVYESALTDSYFLPRIRRRHQARVLIAWLQTSSSARVAELLGAGADEVLDGTMDDRELVARVRNAAHHRRVPRERVIEIGPLRISTSVGEATWNEQPLPLTQREHDVLRALAEAGDEPVRREIIYRKVWGYTMVRGDRTVDVNVRRLRNKLADSGAELSIRTVPGIGYRLSVLNPLHAEISAVAS
jgi:DNA-binding response OmpR family regulator